MSNTPLVSIVLPMYNAGEYIADCIQSILEQTYQNYELIVIDDGSTDNSVAIVESFNDKRIILIRSSHNYIASLNLGLQRSNGKYIARMDADDIMFPTRLAEQVATMEMHSSIFVCASYMEIMESKQITNSGIQSFIPDIKEILLLGNFISHPTTMIRSEYLQKTGLNYNPEYIYAEDYKLWVDIALEGGAFYIIPKPLTKYRISKSQVSSIYSDIQVSTTLRIKNELLQELMLQNRVYSNEIEQLYSSLSRLNELEILQDEAIFWLFYKLFSNIHFKLTFPAEKV